MEQWIGPLLFAGLNVSPKPKQRQVLDPLGSTRPLVLLVKCIDPKAQLAEFGPLDTAAQSRLFSGPSGSQQALMSAPNTKSLHVNIYIYLDQYLCMAESHDLDSFTPCEPCHSVCRLPTQPAEHLFPDDICTPVFQQRKCGDTWDFD